MAESDHLKKISWFEKFTYQLIKDIDHSAFHRKREEKLKKYRSVNSALIRIFAYRLTYRNFEMLKLTMSQIAEEIASDEVKSILIQLESGDEKENSQEGDNASDLIKIIIFLLREEVERCLDEVGDIDGYLTETPLSDTIPEKKQTVNKAQKHIPEVKEKERQKEEKADRKRLTSSSGGSLIFKEEIPSENPSPMKKDSGKRKKQPANGRPLLRAALSYSKRKFRLKNRSPNLNFRLKNQGPKKKSSRKRKKQTANG